MTEKEKSRIIALREKGVGFAAIAERMGMPMSTVRSFYRRGLENGTIDTPKEPAESRCKRCGTPIQSIPQKRKKTFCTDACRYAYAYQFARKPTKHAVCAHCGRPFGYTNTIPRKYCGYPCYIAARFKRGLTL